MYSVFRYLISCHVDGPTVNPNPIRTKGKPNRVKNPGAPAEVAPHIQKMEKPRKINPNGIVTKLGIMRGVFTGLPLHRTFSPVRKLLAI
jgi:hypothetical protein